MQHELEEVSLPTWTFPFGKARATNGNDLNYRIYRERFQSIRATLAEIHAECS